MFLSTASEVCHVASIVAPGSFELGWRNIAISLTSVGLFKQFFVYCRPTVNVVSKWKCPLLRTNEVSGFIS